MDKESKGMKPLCDRTCPSHRTIRGRTETLSLRGLVTPKTVYHGSGELSCVVCSVALQTYHEGAFLTMFKNASSANKKKCRANICPAPQSYSEVLTPVGNPPRAFRSL